MSVLTSITDLPHHTIADILSRLPAKSIIQCRCVCKAWHHILLSPEFARFHHLKSPTSLLIHHFSSRYDVFKLVELEDECDSHGLHHYDHVIKFNLRACFGQAHLLGSIHGLICLCAYNDNEVIYICNPTVRQYFKLPKTKYRREYPLILVYGFGFSPVSGHYKVVQICRRPIIDPITMAISYQSEGMVYTLGTDTWRSIKNVPFSSFGPGVYLNGNLHWLIADDLHSPEWICSFDIERETFELVASPPHSSCENRWMIGLGTLGKCLCVCDSSSDTHLTIWVMKEYGVKESWNKDFVITKVDPDLAVSKCTVVYYPLKVWNNGDILMAGHRENLLLFSYSPAKKSMEKHQILRTSDLFPSSYMDSEVMPHVASFNSLKDHVGDKFRTF